MVTQQKSPRFAVIAALGIVFGDIGTSPLYAFQAAFSSTGPRLSVTPDNITGVISLIIWALTLVVSVKFVGFIMKSDNHGEGGVLALLSIIADAPRRSRHTRLMILIGLMGAALFYGDSAVTPAISVLAAVEGVKTILPGTSGLVVPVTVTIISLLFFLQRYGTAKIARFFGPVMLAWFGVIAAGGLTHIMQDPEILVSLSPITAASFITHHPWLALIAASVVVLVITGAEALYADMGQLGRKPITTAWFFVVMPALFLCYLGQGALLLHDPAAVSNSFMLLFPVALRLPVLLLATAATLIASQSVISGAFSLTRQAMQLNSLPKMVVKHTSDLESGQIYLPIMNALLFVAVVSLVLLFGTSSNLSGAYGVAVSLTLAADTLLYLFVQRSLEGESCLRVSLLGVVFVSLDATFVAATVPKLMSGGLIPVLIGLVALCVFEAWRSGERIIARERRQLEGSLSDYITQLRPQMKTLVRVPGQAVYIGHHPGFAPLAFHESIEETNELRDNVIILWVTITNVAHVEPSQRAQVSLVHTNGIRSLELRFGYHDVINVPKTLQSLHRAQKDFNFNPEPAYYFVSASKVVVTPRHNLAPWRKVIFTFLERNQASSTAYFKLPLERTTEVSTMLKL